MMHMRTREMTGNDWTESVTFEPRPNISTEYFFFLSKRFSSKSCDLFRWNFDKDQTNINTCNPEKLLVRLPCITSWCVGYPPHHSLIIITWCIGLVLRFRVCGQVRGWMYVVGCSTVIVFQKHKNGLLLVLLSSINDDWAVPDLQRELAKVTIWRVVGAGLLQTFQDYLFGNYVSELKQQSF